MADLLGKRVVYCGFSGVIDSLSATRIAGVFNLASNQLYDEVHFCLNSLGGTVADGIYLYNHIRGLPIKTIIYNTGNISSIALAVYLAGEERCCSKYSLFMAHPTFFNPRENMTADRAKSLLESSLAEDDRINEILCDRTSTPEHILAGRRIGDVHIKPIDAVKYGIAHALKEFVLPRGVEFIQI